MSVQSMNYTEAAFELFGALMSQLPLEQRLDVNGSLSVGEPGQALSALVYFADEAGIEIAQVYRDMAAEYDAAE